MAAPKSQFNIAVFRGFKGSGTYVWSPFSMKLETRLRFAGVSYRTEAGSPPKAPRGKIPYIEIAKGDEPVTTIADTTLITGKLIEDGVITDLNARLEPAESAYDLALSAMMEDKLYFYQLYERWFHNYYTMRSGVLATVPWPMQVIVGLIVYRKVMNTLYGQGTLRFTADEIACFRQQIWEKINGLLAASRSKASSGEAPFWTLGGSEPTEADAVLYGFISSSLVCAAAPETGKLLRSLPAVMDYAERIHNRYFPDYVHWD